MLNMVVARLLIKAGKNLVLERAVDELFKTYHRFASRQHEHEETVNGYQIPDNNYFRGGSLKDIARRYGLEGLLSDYNHSLFDRIKSYLAELGKLTAYLRDVAQQKISAQPVQLYARVASAYKLMAEIIGYKTAPEPIRYGYLSDLVNDYLHKIGDLDARLDRFLSVAQGFYTSGSGMVEALAKRSAKFVAKQVLENKGIPFGSIDKVVSSITKPFAEARKIAKPMFADYNDVVKKWQTAYSGDVSTYISRNYAAAT